MFINYFTTKKHALIIMSGHYEFTFYQELSDINTVELTELLCSPLFTGIMFLDRN